MKEFNSSRDFNHKSHNKRVKDGTGNASSVKLCESYPWGTRGCLSPASPAIDLFPRVPWDKRLLQAEERKKKQAKIKLITRKLAKRAGRFVFHKYNKSKDVLQLLQRLKFGQWFRFRRGTVWLGQLVHNCGRCCKCMERYSIQFRRYSDRLGVFHIRRRLYLEQFIF